jgi:hypothetical protein
MFRLAVVSCIAFVAVAFVPTLGSAQINARTLTLAGVSDCVAEAIATKAVDDGGSAVIFSCDAAKAKTLYNFLGKKIRTEVVQDRNGKFENRAFGNSACYHQIEDQSGKAADQFRCDLVMYTGDALAD